MDAALIYAQHGLYVLPAEGGGKNPGRFVGRGWPVKSSTNPDTIRSWWNVHPSANIGLHCGRSGGLAFDIDDPHLLARVPVLQRALTTLNPPFQSSNANVEGKGHALFSCPAPGVGNSTRNLDNGSWGQIRSYNQIIVLSPSVHQKRHAGGQYEWRRIGQAPEPSAELWPLLCEPSAWARGSEAETLEFLESLPEGDMCPELVEILERPSPATNYRHETYRGRQQDIVRRGEQGHYGVALALEILEQQYFDTKSASEDKGAWARMLDGAVAKVKAEPTAGGDYCGEHSYMQFMAWGFNLEAIMQRENAKHVATDGPEVPSGAPVIDLSGWQPVNPAAYNPTTPANNAKWAWDHFTHTGRKPLYRWDDEWFTWEGNHYRRLADGEMNAFLWRKFDAAKFWTEPTAMQKAEQRSWNPNPTNIGNVSRAMEGFYWLPPWVEDNTWIRGDRRRVTPFNNTLLDLETLQPMPHSADYFNTACSAVNFDPNAPEPAAFLKLLADQWGPNSEQQMALQEFIGYLFSGETRYHKMLLLYGEERSGKGTVVKVLQQLLGSERFTSMTSHAFETEYGAENLVGTDMCVIDDKQDGGDTSAIVERLLSIIGEASVSIPRKFKKAWVGRLRTKFVMTANGIPRLRSKSGRALAARVIPLHFSVSFAGREDRYMEERIAGELSAIASWGLKGLQRLRESGAFTESVTMAEQGREVAGISDPLEAFIADCLTPHADGYVTKDDLWNGWVKWGELSNNRQVGTRTDFVSRLAGRLQLQPGKRGARGEQRPALVGITWSEDRPLGVGFPLPPGFR